MADTSQTVAPVSETVAPVSAPAPVVPAATEITTSTDAAPVAAETKVEETKPEVTEPVVADTKAEETKAAEPAKEVEPVSSGVLGYKAPGLVKSLLFSKKYFWAGDEAVPSSSLSSYLRGEKSDVAHPTAAWSSQTGKGLLYFVKHVDEKKSPAGVLNLSEATDLSKDGAEQFSFKLHGHKHAFQAKTSAERDGWFITVEKEVEEAKTAAEGIKSSEGYKEALEKLSKPALPATAVAATSAKEEATPKKSTDIDGAAEPVDTTRAGSSSGDEAKKSKSKSRSVSRGKRASIFGSLLAKKDEKKEEKAEEKKVEEEAKVEPEVAAATDAAVPVAAAPAAPVVASEAPVAPVVVPEAEKPVATEPAATEPVTETTATTETETAKPKPAKRQSLFGGLFEKVRSPTSEKKESEVVPAKAAEPATATEAPVVEPTPAVAPEAAPVVATETPAVTEAKAEDVKPEETKATTVSPSKEKKEFSFGKLFGSKDRAKSPAAAEKIPAPAEEPPKIEEGAPKIETTEALVNPADVVAAEPATTETKTEEPAAPITQEKRRSSFFGNLTGGAKKEKKTDAETTETTKDEKHPSKLSGLFRNPSKAVKSKKDKENVAPAKADETVEPKEEIPPVPTLEKTEPAAAETAAAPQSIGDVVPEAVHAGQAQPSNPTVQATA